jgi:hypothetical protein
MKRQLTLLGASSLLLLVPVQASAQQCLSVCNQYAPCDRVCRMYAGGPWTTCGQWGDCQTCHPNYQVISSHLDAIFWVDYFSTCDEIAVYSGVFHDVNNCPGSQDYVGCANSKIHTHGYGGCCLDVYCGGSGPCSPYSTEVSKETSGGASRVEDWTSWNDAAPPAAAVQCAASGPPTKP